MAAPNGTPDAHKKLEIAIDDLSELRLRNLMKGLCRKFPELGKRVGIELLTTEEAIQRHAESQSEKSADLKRPRPRYVICDNCDEEFDVLDNPRECCRYHPKPSEPNYDFFEDHDEDCHGIIDSEGMREEFPEGFIHPCCNRTGEEEPCEVDRHVERPAKRTRTY
ncbi:hypothetical protein FQN50_002500 [Emmonsiellopsis sp. PD_5]|nr:hypothetical protein FQN50_002500 [Emmonsiellopsis sp. PD_5]